jgi:hypothetical protein
LALLGLGLVMAWRLTLVVWPVPEVTQSLQILMQKEMSAEGLISSVE